MGIALNQFLVREDVVVRYRCKVSGEMGIALIDLCLPPDKLSDRKLVIRWVGHHMVPHDNELPVRQVGLPKVDEEMLVRESHSQCFRFYRSSDGKNLARHIGNHLLGLRSDRPFRRAIHLFNDFLTLFLPVTNAAKLTRFVTRFDELFGSARRAPSTPSVENEPNILGDVLHPLVELGHRDMDGARDRAVLFQFPVLADIDQEEFLAPVEFLLQL